ncbi:MAG: DUF945 family protein [Campylobacteraceae bacterium]
MKKVLAFLVFIVVVAYFGVTFYASKKVDDFFSKDSGIIFDKFGVTLKVTNSTKGFFSSTYESELVVFAYNEAITVAKLSHEAKFGIRGFNYKKIGNIKTNVLLDPKVYKKLTEMEDISLIKENFTINSELGFDGVLTKKALKAGNYVNEDTNINATWKDINSDFFISYDQLNMKFNTNLPQLLIKDMSEKSSYELKIENMSYAFDTIDINNFWHINSNFLFDNFSIKEDNSEVLEILKFATTSKTSAQNKELFSLITTINADSFKITNQEKSTSYLANNINYKETVGNIDFENTKEIFNSLSDVYFGMGNTQMGLMAITLPGNFLNILKNKPIYSIDDFSFVFEGEKQNFKGFIQFVGDTKKLAKMQDFSKIFDGGFRVDISENIFDKLLYQAAKDEFERENRRIYSIWELSDTELKPYLKRFDVKELYEFNDDEQDIIISEHNSKIIEIDENGENEEILKIAQTKKDKLKEFGIESKDKRVNAVFEYKTGDMILNNKPITKEESLTLF